MLKKLNKFLDIFFEVLYLIVGYMIAIFSFILMFTAKNYLWIIYLIIGLLTLIFIIKETYDYIKFNFKNKSKNNYK